jgi:hypothetical protein
MTVYRYRDRGSENIYDFPAKTSHWRPVHSGRVAALSRTEDLRPTCESSVSSRQPINLVQVAMLAWEHPRSRRGFTSEPVSVV